LAAVASKGTYENTDNHKKADNSDGDTDGTVGTF
jgi:hypothetical protein